MKKFTELITAEENKLNRCKEQKEKLDEKIRNYEASIEELKNKEKTQKYNAAEHLFSIKGVSLEEVLKAVESGNLHDLQEKIDGTKNDVPNPAETSEESVENEYKNEDEDIENLDGDEEKAS